MAHQGKTRNQADGKLIATNIKAEYASGESEQELLTSKWVSSDEKAKKTERK